MAVAGRFWSRADILRTSCGLRGVIDIHSAQCAGRDQGRFADTGDRQGFISWDPDNELFEGVVEVTRVQMGAVREGHAAGTELRDPSVLLHASPSR